MPRKTLRTLARMLLGGSTALAALLPSERASASFTIVPPPAVAEASASYKYANMSDVEAYAELDKRKVPYKKADPIPGVIAPVRLTGKLHGVWIHSSIPESQRATSIYEVLDARLALALDDFAKILERHDIEEVVHYSLYRPNVPREDHDVKAPADLPALPAVGKSAPADTKGTATAAPIGAKSPASDAKGAVVGAKSQLPSKSALPGAAVSKPGVAAAPKGNKAVPAKTPALPAKTPALPAKGQAPKPALPAAPAKALPQLPAKSTPPVHGAKHKAPLEVDKAVAPAAAPASAAVNKPVAPAKGAVHKPVAPAAAPHAKTTAAKAVPPVRARSAGTSGPSGAPRTTSPAKAGNPVAGAKPGAIAKASPAPAAPVAAKAATGTVAAAKTPTVPVSRQTWASPGTRHPAGLAIDVALLKKRDGQWISVANDFHGKIGAKTCGDGVPNAATPEARELRSLVCESGDLGVFTYVLTPNYNAAHYDHFHMEIRPATKWFLYH